MHNYSIDSHPREKLIFLLSYVAIVSASAITNCVNNLLSSHAAQEFLLKFSLIQPIVISLPVVGIFGGLFWAFDKFWWKYELPRKLLIVPDLNGDWICEGKTIYKDGQHTELDWTGTVTITQSWSKIMIFMDTMNSTSRSLSATIRYVEGVGHKIFYQYESKPKAGNTDMRIHSGAMELDFNSDVHMGEGYYYTDHQRSTVGRIIIRKK